MTLSRGVRLTLEAVEERAVPAGGWPGRGPHAEYHARVEPPDVRLAVVVRPIETDRRDGPGPRFDRLPPPALVIQAKVVERVIRAIEQHDAAADPVVPLIAASELPARPIPAKAEAVAGPAPVEPTPAAEPPSGAAERGVAAILRAAAPNAISATISPPPVAAPQAVTAGAAPPASEPAVAPPPAPPASAGAVGSPTTPTAGAAPGPETSEPPAAPDAPPPTPAVPFVERVIEAVFPDGVPSAGALVADLAAVEAAAAVVVARLIGGDADLEIWDAEKWAWASAAVLLAGGATYAGRGGRARNRAVAPNAVLARWEGKHAIGTV